MIDRLRKRMRLVFWVYAAIIFTLTHWPRFGIESPFHRPDLVAHAVAFSLWTMLLSATAYLGPRRSMRNLVLSMLVALVYACVDEGLQAIPFLHRHVSLDDLLANFLGVAIGTVLTLAFIVITGRRGSE